MRTRSLALLLSLSLFACGDETGDPPIGGSNEGGAAAGGEANGGAGPVIGGGGGGLGGAGGSEIGGGGSGGQGGSGGAGPGCPVDWVVGIGEQVGTATYHSAKLPGGDVIVGGESSPFADFYDNTGYYAQPLLVRLSPSGQEIWRVSLPASNEAWLRGLVTGADGTIFIAGQFKGTLTFGATTLSAPSQDLFVAALDADGMPLWIKQFGDAQIQTLTDMAIDANGELVIGGTLFGSVDFGGGALTATTAPDLYLARLTASGDHIASRVISNGQTDWLTSLDVTPDGRVLIGAEYADVATQGQLVEAYSPDLTTRLWQTATDEITPQVRALPNGSAVVVGTFLGMHTLDATGAVTSSASQDSGSYGIAPIAVAVTSDGLVCVTGSASAPLDLGTGPLVPDSVSNSVIGCYDASWTPQFALLFQGGASAIGRFLPLGPGAGLVAGNFNGFDLCGSTVVVAGDRDGVAARLSY
ncbi:MAG: hypothetical protein U0271_38465 [Polyangiaceae bacterium]